ncbi:MULTISPECIES: hypothetical protein [unclassified Modestobacter]|uniref:hypothetical protein n=1 Tax=unclassified Modestobacter TaxID=2643866 RepID=UPI0022AA8576|nr:MULTISPECIES: hypothetical protein [unclassified Modestobacter]MCZ2824189.1 hypothetical protein [Modestobacter sp. VKM Ac-2981]MCZ2854283.1 hypothetical protein [Modestobacter sp. VKM Ac-2982]
MAVMVRTARTSTGTRTTFTHKEANGIGIQDGHLLVQKWNGMGYDTVAAYAPGQWIDATTEEPEQK